jgi:hypothetical protein
LKGIENLTWEASLSRSKQQNDAYGLWFLLCGTLWPYSTCLRLAFSDVTCFP